LVCPAFLSSKYINEDELPFFITPDGKPGIKPVIAVGLTKLDFDHQDLRGLQEQQIFRWQSRSSSPQKFFSDLQTIKDKREFAHSLFVKCQTALDQRFQGSQATESLPVAANTNSRRKLLEATIQQRPLLQQIELDSDQEHSNDGDPGDPTGDVAQALLNQARFGLDPERLRHFEKPRAATSPGAQPVDALEYLHDWLSAEKAPPILYVLGDYGIGKTTTLKHLTHELLERRKADLSVPVPLFIDLRHYLFERKQHVPTSIQELLTAVIARNWRLPGPPNVTADDILEMVRDERALMIFDGLDEKTVHMTSSEARAFIRVLWQSLPEGGHSARSK
jgi:Cdc6-like AAA superfamily ATPase